MTFLHDGKGVRDVAGRFADGRTIVVHKKA
jgi:hypothetical protein